MLLEDIFHQDGRCKFIYFGNATTKRGAVLKVKIFKQDTSYIVEGKDFHQVYNKAIEEVLYWLNRPGDVDITCMLFDSIDPFLHHYQLRLKTVTITALALDKD